MTNAYVRLGILTNLCRNSQKGWGRNEILYLSVSFQCISSELAFVLRTKESL